MFQWFHLFQSYVEISVLCCKCLSGCCICFIHMFSSVCSKYFIYFGRMLHSSISCCKRFMFHNCVQRVMGRGAPRVLRTWHARPHPGFRVPPVRRGRCVARNAPCVQRQARPTCAERERRGVARKEPHTQRQGWVAHMGRCEVDDGGLPGHPFGHARPSSGC
jgi:hypothetical protein